MTTLDCRGNHGQEGFNAVGTHERDPMHLTPPKTGRKFEDLLVTRGPIDRFASETLLTTISIRPSIKNES